MGMPCARAFAASGYPPPTPPPGYFNACTRCHTPKTPDQNIQNLITSFGMPPQPLSPQKKTSASFGPGTKRPDSPNMFAVTALLTFLDPSCHKLHPSLVLFSQLDISSTVLVSNPPASQIAPIEITPLQSPRERRNHSIGPNIGISFFQQDRNSSDENISKSTSFPLTSLSCATVFWQYIPAFTQSAAFAQLGINGKHCSTWYLSQ